MGIGVVSLVAVVATAYVLLPFAATAAVRALALALNGTVWLAAAIGSGADRGAIVRTVANAVAAALTTPTASAGIAALVILGALALFGLQWLLGSEEDSPR